jgi:hypothetical protein
VSEVTLIEAAAALGKSYNQTLRLVLVGVLRGERKAGRWYVAGESLARMMATIARDSARKSVGG